LPLILDTHYAYFLADRPSALSQREQDVVFDADAELLISAVFFLGVAVEMVTPPCVR